MNDGVYLDAASVAIDIQFIENLTLTKSTKSGRPEKFKLLPPHRKAVENILGWRKADGSRLIRRAYLSFARKNAKTQLAAALGLNLLVCDNEASPEIYVAAKDRDQAGICFEAAAAMVNADEELTEILRVIPYAKEIRHRATGGKLKALSSEGKGKHGYNPSTVIIDEFHVWGPAEKELYDALTSGSVARRNPLFIIITTAGIDEHSLCGEEYNYAKRILAGIEKNPSYYADIYELPKDADWTDESLWHLANPTLGDIVTIEALRELCEKAKAMPSEQISFRRLNCNQWVNSRDLWIPLQKWDACFWNGYGPMPHTAASISLQ